MVTKSKFIFILVASKSSLGRSSTVNCFLFFENGDQLLKFLVESPSKILTLPSKLEDQYYSSAHAAKISDYYFFALKYLTDNVGISHFLTHRSNGFLNLIPAVTGILVFSVLLVKRPDYTLLTKILTISNPHVYAFIIGINTFLSWEVVKKSVDFSATSLNVIIGVWASDFFSQRQAWVVSDRIAENLLKDAKTAAKVVILSTLQCSEEAQRHLKLHKRLLNPLESYFNPCEVEQMDIVTGEFSSSEMVLITDKLNNLDEFSSLKGTVSIQTLLFLLACRELKPSFSGITNSKASTIDEREKEPVNKGLKFCRRGLKLLAYRSPTLRPLIRAKMVLRSSCSFVKFAKTSYKNRLVKQRNTDIAYLERCFHPNKINK